MSQYTTDDINFHGFLTAMRAVQERTLEEVSRGLYSKSMMKRIETGERLPKKLERDRIVARLGVSGERYEDYLPRDDYELWVQRQDMVESVDRKDWASLEKQMEAYKGKKRRTKVEKQFLEAMRFMMLQGTGASEEELRESIELAVPYTIPSIKRKFPKNLLLSPQEINLFMEYVRLHIPKKADTEKKLRKWRFTHYNNIFKYINQSCLDNLGKSKVYPKLVYFVCKEYDVETSSVKDIQTCLELCDKAIELLRDTRRMYYLVELLEVRQVYIARLLLENIAEENKAELSAVLKTTKDWEELFKDLYAKYNVCPYMENFCHLYWETESHCVNDVIRIRRHMLGLTQEQISEMVCSTKTLRRIEHKKTNAQIFEVRGLFKELGLCPEYVRANVVTSDPEAIRLHLLVRKYGNMHEFEEWEDALTELEDRLCMDIIQNKQIVTREKLVLELEMHKIEVEEFVQRMEELISLTMPLGKIIEAEEWYLTEEEISNLYTIGAYLELDCKKQCSEILTRYINCEIEENHVKERIAVYDTIITGIASYLGNMGEYNDANRLIEVIVKCNLEKRRMSSLANNLYNEGWNNNKAHGGELVARKELDMGNVLDRCILLSDFIKSPQYRHFFESKK